MVWLVPILEAQPIIVQYMPEAWAWSADKTTWASRAVRSLVCASLACNPDTKSAGLLMLLLPSLTTLCRSLHDVLV